MADKKNIGTEGNLELDWLEDMKDFNKDLEERILEANKDETKIKWRNLLPDLMGAEILMVGQIGQPTEDGKKQLQLLMIQKDGKVVVPFFTSQKRIETFIKQNHIQLEVMKINTVLFFRSVMGKPTVMNPFSTYSRVFTPFEMMILAAENEDKIPDNNEKTGTE